MYRIVCSLICILSLVYLCVYNKVMIFPTGGDLIHVFGERGSELGQFDCSIMVYQSTVMV